MITTDEQLRWTQEDLTRTQDTLARMRSERDFYYAEMLACAAALEKGTVRRDEAIAACQKALTFHDRYCDRVGPSDSWARSVHTALRNIVYPTCHICGAVMTSAGCPDAAAHDEIERASR